MSNEFRVCYACKKVYRKDRYYYCGEEKFEDLVKIPSNEFIRKQWFYYSMKLSYRNIPDEQSYLCRLHFDVTEDIRLLKSRNISVKNIEEEEFVKMKIVGYDSSTLIRYGEIPKSEVSDTVINFKTKRTNLHVPISDYIRPKSDWSRIPRDLLFDVFSLLPRNEIEKFQYVSKIWDNTIMGYVNYLPLRTLQQFKMPTAKDQYFSIKYNSLEFKVGKLIGSSLRTFNISCLRWDFRGRSGQILDKDDPVRSYQQLDFRMNAIGALRKRTNAKIKTKHFEYETKTAVQDVEFLSVSKKLLENILDAYKAYLYLSAEVFYKIFEEGSSIIEDSGWPKRMHFDSKFAFKQRMDIEWVEAFVRNRKQDNREISIYPFSQSEGFVEDYVRLFFKTEHPAKLFKKICKVGTDTSDDRILFEDNHFNSIIRQLNRISGVHYRTEKTHEKLNNNYYYNNRHPREVTIHYFEFKRKDSWKLLCIMHSLEKTITYKVFQ